MMRQQWRQAAPESRQEPWQSPRRQTLGHWDGGGEKSEVDPFWAVAIVVGQEREGADEWAREAQRRLRRPENRETVEKNKGCRVKGIHRGKKKEKHIL